ncbi:hypothetical protein AB5J55_01910 [Streptomyces sp. R11]|uniref:Uncharacterized protein n=1 Tax=Streptomyces sp. R11 TaxID=3238625 RepID=A0AB39MT15_9ACTN
MSEFPYAFHVELHRTFGLRLEPGPVVGPDPVEAALSGHRLGIRLRPTGPDQASIVGLAAEITDRLPPTTRSVMTDDVLEPWEPDLALLLDTNPPELRMLPSAPPLSSTEPIHSLDLAPITADLRVTRWLLRVQVNCAGELYEHVHPLYATATTNMLEIVGDRRSPMLPDQVAPTHWHGPEHRSAR